MSSLYVDAFFLSKVKEEKVGTLEEMATIVSVLSHRQRGGERRLKDWLLHMAGIEAQEFH